MNGELGFIVIGTAVGFLVGLTGLGGGILMTPMLLLAGLPPVYAIGTDLVYATFTKLFASTLHLREKNVDLRVVRTLLFGSVPGVFIGFVFTVVLIERFGLGHLNDLLTLFLAILLILFSVVSLISMARNLLRNKGQVRIVPNDVRVVFQDLWDQEADELRLMAQPRHSRRIGLVGGALLVGFLVQLTSVGSGVMITLLLLTIMPAKRVVGTELLHAFVLVALSSAIYLYLGFVNFVVLALIVAGSLPGTYLGVKFASYLPTNYLKAILMVLLFLVGLFLLFMDGTH